MEIKYIIMWPQPFGFFKTLTVIPFRMSFYFSLDAGTKSSFAMLPLKSEIWPIISFQSVHYKILAFDNLSFRT